MEHIYTLIEMIGDLARIAPIFTFPYILAAVPITFLCLTELLRIALFPWFGKTAEEKSIRNFWSLKTLGVFALTFTVFLGAFLMTNGLALSITNAIIEGHTYNHVNSDLTPAVLGYSIIAIMVVSIFYILSNFVLFRVKNNKWHFDHEILSVFLKEQHA